MFMLRTSALRSSLRTFSTSARAADMAKLTLIGRLGAEPETRMGKNEKEFVQYSVGVSGPSTVDANGERQTSTTWHRVFAFNPATYPYLSSMAKGSLVYVEAACEMRDAEPAGESSPAHKTMFLRQESIRVLSKPKTHTESS
ncbi:hypothetical protein DL96DRAFT_1593720 [Flagelloscypha sp. PMI_526]|nr:hypothetical protein DL96DRAFT_1593720 [Flagelloscypha sp. PMI_526]